MGHHFHTLFLIAWGTNFTSCSSSLGAPLCCLEKLFPTLFRKAVCKPKFITLDESITGNIICESNEISFYKPISNPILKILRSSFQT